MSKENNKATKPSIFFSGTPKSTTLTKEPKTPENNKPSNKKPSNLETLSLDLQTRPGSRSVTSSPIDPKRIRPQTLVSGDTSSVERNKSFNYSPTPGNGSGNDKWDSKPKVGRALSFSRRDSMNFDLSQQQQAANEKAVQLREQV